jgi:carbonic anhydrase
MRKPCLLIVIVVLLTATAKTTATEPNQTAGNHARDTSAWDYSSLRGPEYWDEIIDEATALDVRDFLPESLADYTYDGSLTTPPATEGVRWFVLQQPLHMTRAQIAAINRVYYSNNRPTQPLNARFVLTRR